MKLRIKHYGYDMYTVQRLWLGIFWISVTCAIVFERNRLIRSRLQPLLFHSFEEAERKAIELSVPGAMRKHISEQDEIWAAAKSRFREVRNEHRKIKVISS